MTVDPGLRERKKLATRSALTTAALQLAVERGVDAVTAEDVADAAGVSVRTFFNYFATKEQAFVADDLERGRRFVEAVTQAPEDVALWPLLRQTAAEVLAVPDLPSREQALKEQLVRTNPGVLAEATAAFARLEEELVVELLRRDPSSGALHARLLANAVLAAVRSATETWLSPDAGGRSFSDLLDEAFTVLAPAFP